MIPSISPDWPLPGPGFAGSLPYSPDDEPCVTPAEVSRVLYRDARVSWVSHYALEPRSEEERAARHRFSGLVLQGHHALEALWYACLVDRGPLPSCGISLAQWRRYWCTGLLGTVASLWMRDPEVQAHLGRGHREGVTLAQGLLPAVVVRLYQIGMQSTSWLAQVSALREIARIAGSLPDVTPDPRVTIEERRARAREILARHLPAESVSGVDAILGCSEVPGGEIGSQEHLESIEAEIGAATTTARGSFSSLEGGDERPDPDDPHAGASWDRATRATPPPVRMPGPGRGEAEGRGGGAAGATQKCRLPPVSEQISIPLLPAPHPNSNSHKPGPKPLPPGGHPVAVQGAGRVEKSKVVPREEATITPSYSPSSSVALPPRSGESWVGQCPPPSGDPLMDEMRQRISRAREKTRGKGRPGGDPS